MKLIKIFTIFIFSVTASLATSAADEVIPAKPEPYAKQLKTASTTSCSTAKLQVQVDACATSAQTAASWCMAESSPKIHMGIVAVGGLLAGVSMMKSMSDSCSKFNEAMKMGQLALTAYTTSCSIVQSQCDTACGTLSTAVNAAIAAANVNGVAALTGSPEYLESICAKAVETPTIAVVGKCSGYKTSMLAAGAGIMSMLQQSGLMGKCEKETVVADCTKDPTNAQCPQSVDCTNPTNAQNAICICKSNPTAAGCGSTTANSSGAPSAGTPTNVTGAGALDPGSFGGGGSDNFISPSGAAPAGGSSLGGGASGGGGGGSGGGGTGGAKEKEGLKKSGLNANILGGYEGGGGGGGSRGGSANSGLKDYLPGGAKDPNRNIAAQGAGSGEVTAAGSKSNWEKVTDRYQDNKRTLMGP